jgi:hypothetical protein
MLLLQRLNKMKNVKTTTLGILTILLAVCRGGMESIKSGSISDLSGLIAQISAGIGLIVASDSK